MRIAKIAAALIVGVAWTLAVSGQGGGRETGAFWRRVHLTDDSLWAKETHLSEATIRRLRVAAGVVDELHDTRITQLDVTSLKNWSQVFLVSASGDAHCLTLHVLRANFEHPTSVWTESEMPDGAGFCQERQLGNPRAFVRAGEIVVEIPAAAKSDRKQGVVTRSIVYAWNGKTYVLKSDSHAAAR